MTDMSKIAGVLLLSKDRLGVSSEVLAEKSGVNRDSIRKRIHELRTKKGLMIYTHQRKVNGETKYFYRLVS